MPNVYKNASATIPDLEALATVDPIMISIVTGELLKDSNKQGVAPKQDGTLVNSSILNSLLDDGLIIYKTPYARRVYFEGNISGKLMWVDVTAKQNKDKYRKMLAKLIETKKDKIF